MKNLIKKIQQKIYAIWKKTKQHIFSFVGGQFNKRQKRKKKITMSKFNDFGIIAVIFSSLLVFFRGFLHRPLRKIKYYRHKILHKYRH